jgi:hypothetical protein
MGVTTARALQARRRASSAHIDRLIAKADERSPIGSVRRARIKDAAQLARRKARALEAAHQAVTVVEVEIGIALLRLVDQGMSRNEAFELAGLRRHLGRRYLDLAERPQTSPRPGFSTASADDAVPRPPGSDGDPDGAQSGAGTTGRNY